MDESQLRAIMREVYREEWAADEARRGARLEELYKAAQEPVQNGLDRRLTGPHVTVGDLPGHRLTGPIPESSGGGRIPPQTPTTEDSILPESPSRRCSSERSAGVSPTQFSKLIEELSEATHRECMRAMYGPTGQPTPRWHLVQAGKHLRHAAKLIFRS